MTAAAATFQPPRAPGDPRPYLIYLHDASALPAEGDVLRHHFAREVREPVFHLVLGARLVKHRRTLPAGYTAMGRLIVQREVPVDVATEAREAGGELVDTWPSPKRRSR